MASAIRKNAPISSLLISLMLVIVAGNRNFFCRRFVLLRFSFFFFNCKSRLFIWAMEGLEAVSIGDEGSELSREILRDEAVERINQLAKVRKVSFLF